MRVTILSEFYKVFLQGLYYRVFGFRIASNLTAAFALASHSGMTNINITAIIAIIGTQSSG